MADSNNTLADRLPAKPYPALKTLERLIGTWDVTGPFIEGSVKFEWLKGEFFLVQHVDVHRGDHKITGIEYIGFDEETETLRSHYMDNNGSNFTYTWNITGNMLKIWFGDKGSDNFFEGHFAENGDSYSGKWQWPGGGYEATMTRSK